MAHIEWELTQGQYALIDIEDLLKVEQYSWQASWQKSTKSYRAVTTSKVDRKYLYMSRIIMGLEVGDKRKADHVNHNTLDNRRENLRVVSNKQNQQNRLDVRGYYWNSCQKKWHVQMRVDGKTNHVGYFHTEEAARLAYLNAREEYGYIDSPSQQSTVSEINILEQEASTA